MEIEVEFCWKMKFLSLFVLISAACILIRDVSEVVSSVVLDGSLIDSVDIIGIILGSVVDLLLVLLDAGDIAYYNYETLIFDIH